MIVANKDQYLELEKIAIGAFAPLKGFMNQDDFQSVVDTMHLKQGSVFPLPIVLDVDEKLALAIKPGMTVPILFGPEQVGAIAVESIYRCDKVAAAKKLFGIDDIIHPGVARFYRMGDYFLGGEVTLTKRAQFEFSDLDLTPEETKKLFNSKGLKTVAGFQTRNVPHRAHEYLQRLALEIVDGLFVQPLVGRKKAGDYTPDAVVTAYRHLIGEFFPPERVVLGILSTAMRYAGPREAVFHALIRRNYGCTHFVVGRDHAGVGGFYGKYESQNLALHFQDELAIKILPFAGPYHCTICDGIVTERTCRHAVTHPKETNEISGTLIRKILISGDRAHKEWMRPEILESVEGIKLFIDSDEEEIAK